jgi:hypothetical protein
MAGYKAVVFMGDEDYTIIQLLERSGKKGR